MSGALDDRDATMSETARPIEPVRYPANHVIAVLDTQEQVAAVAEALTGDGFADSEIHVSCGAAAADRLQASTGRRGLAGLAIRIAERLGIEDEEMEFKAHYEQALRDGRYVTRVAAPTEERKARALQLLREHDAHTISHHGRFTIEAIAPPKPR